MSATNGQVEEFEAVTKTLCYNGHKVGLARSLFLIVRQSAAWDSGDCRSGKSVLSALLPNPEASEKCLPKKAACLICYCKNHDLHKVTYNAINNVVKTPSTARQVVSTVQSNLSIASSWTAGFGRTEPL